MDVFAPVIWEEYAPTSWPERIVCDSTDLKTSRLLSDGSRSKRTHQAFSLMVVAGWEKPGASPKAWWADVCGQENESAWNTILSNLDGTPQLIVSDGSKRITNAIKATFPKPGDPDPEVRRCEWHLAKNIRDSLPDNVAPPRRSPHTDEVFPRDEDGNPEPPHPIITALKSACDTASNWNDFEKLVRYEAEITGGLKGAVRWMDLNSAMVAKQVETRRHAGPNSVGPVETYIKELVRRLEYRAGNFGNRQRTLSLIRLMLLDINGHADEREWADIIRRYLLAANGHKDAGHADHQRQHDDPLGFRSIRR